MLSLYFDTLIIGHTFVIMFSILNELPLQKELQNIGTNNVFWTKKETRNVFKKDKRRRIKKEENITQSCSMRLLAK